MEWRPDRKFVTGNSSIVISDRKFDFDRKFIYNQIMPTRGPYKRKYHPDAKTRRCRVCEVVKPVDQFAPNITRPSGYIAIESKCYQCKRSAKYGITSPELLSMLEDQNNCCAICGIQFARTPAIDHCHNTGKVRGLLCGNCNAGIGMLGDDPEILSKAIAYLQR